MRGAVLAGAAAARPSLRDVQVAAELIELAHEAEGLDAHPESQVGGALVAVMLHWQRIEALAAGAGSGVTREPARD